MIIPDIEIDFNQPKTSMKTEHKPNVLPKLWRVEVTEKNLQNAIRLFEKINNSNLCPGGLLEPGDNLHCLGDSLVVLKSKLEGYTPISQYEFKELVLKPAFPGIDFDSERSTTKEGPDRMTGPMTGIEDMRKLEETITEIETSLAHRSRIDFNLINQYNEYLLLNNYELPFE